MRRALIAVNISLKEKTAGTSLFKYPFAESVRISMRPLFQALSKELHSAVIKMFLT